MDRIREAAGDFDVAAMAAESRINARSKRGEERAADLEARGMHGSAAAIRAREERRRESAAEKMLERMAKEGSKTEKEREREQKESSGGGSGEGAGKTLSDLWQQLKELNTKLPQNALS
jgi:hypothetical protein